MAMPRLARAAAGSRKAASLATGTRPFSFSTEAMRDGSRDAPSMLPAAAGRAEGYRICPLLSFRVTTAYAAPCRASSCAAARSEASSRAAAVSRTPQLPSMMALAGAAAGSDEAGRASEEAAGSAAASDEAATLDAAGPDEAERSRLRTTVYQVWVAQSST